MMLDVVGPRIHWAIAVLMSLGIAAGSCSSSEPDSPSCQRDSDCMRVGPSYACVASRCEPRVGTDGAVVDTGAATDARSTEATPTEDASVVRPCPTSPPADGAACSRQGQTCSWGSHPDPLCRVSAECLAPSRDGGLSGLAWTVTPAGTWCSDQLLAPGCPTSPPTGPCDGDASADTHCYYTDGTKCICARPCCSPSGCVDAFHCMENPNGPRRWACEPPSNVPGCNPFPNAGTECRLSNGTACVGRRSEFGLCGTRDATCFDGFWEWTVAGCSVCASPDTPIATPAGDRAIATIRIGDPVLTVDHGRVVTAAVAEVHRTPVRGHHVVRVELENGSVLEISARHPTADGRTFGELRAGASLGGVLIQRTTVTPYEYPFTYDILPASDSGTYFAGGVLIGSTLGGNTLMSPDANQSSFRLEH